MAFSKQFPIRILLDDESYQALIDALKGNEIDYADGIFADEAQALREKIEKYGRRGTAENGKEFIRLGFYEKEGENLIWQFIAAAKNAREYRELLDFTDKVVEGYANPAETEV
ncbi:hypothetical protein FACS189490_03370 [Clostridia bacterium]|nr:hypothetical protein FACS189490_03370 [Clostridia bacterium]